MGFVELESQQKGPGPRAVLVMGYEKETEEDLRTLLKSIDQSDTPVLYVREGTSSLPLLDVLQNPGEAPAVEADKLPGIMILSGMASDELRLFMQGFKSTGLPRPMFAVTTETNLKMSLKELILHLIEEQKEVARMRQQNRSVTD